MQQRHNATLIFFHNRADSYPLRKPEHSEAPHFEQAFAEASPFLVSVALLQVSDSQAAAVSKFLSRNVLEGSFPSLLNMMSRAI